MSLNPPQKTYVYLCFVMLLMFAMLGTMLRTNRPLPNPYTPRAATPNPVGREQLIRQIEQAIAPVLHTGTAAKGGVVLYGVRGIGKTSILRSVRRTAAVESGFVTVWTSAAKKTSILQNLPALINKALIDNEIISKQKWFIDEFSLELNLGVAKAKMESTKKAKQPDFKWDVISVEQMLRTAASLCASHGGGRGSGLLLFIDELHAVKQSELAILLNVFQNIADDVISSPPFMFLGAGLPIVRGVSTMAATFGERTLFREVTTLNSSDAALAFIEPAAELSVSYTAPAIEVLVKHANGYPFFVQLLGYNAWAVAEPNSGYIITESDALAAVAETESDMLSMFNARFDAITKSERDFVIALAKLGGDDSVRRSDIAAALEKHTDAISMVRRQLIAKAIITEEERGFVKFTLPGFAAFVLDEIGN